MNRREVWYPNHESFERESWSQVQAAYLELSNAWMLSFSIEKILLVVPTPWSKHSKADADEAATKMLTLGAFFAVSARP